MEPSPRTFAVVPAAGRSRRMQEDKLLMPWGKTTIIEQVLANWQQSRVDHVVVVVRPQQREVEKLCRGVGVDVVVPATDPEQMKVSVQHALRYVEETFQPVATDAWLLAPADMPALSPTTINHVIDAYEARIERVFVPAIRGKRGHPALFPWSLKDDVFQLGLDDGVNKLLDAYTVVEVPVDECAILQDIDTHQDLERMRASRKA